MTWQWDQSKGELWRDGAYIGSGYSGKGRGVNNPALQGVQAVGPVPAGQWCITEKYDSPNVGPYALVLRALDATPGDDRHDATGRSAFRIHGDNSRGDRSASKGCIILPRALRQKIWESRDRLLVVVA